MNTRTATCIDCDTVFEYECVGTGGRARSRCPKCKIEHERTWMREYARREDVRGRHNQYQREYITRPEVKPEVKRRQKKYESQPHVRQRTKLKGQRDFFREYYNISHEEYLRLRSDHGPECDICGGRPESLVLDHDHRTGELRGWLCQNCNTSLGVFGDCTEGLEPVLEYLRQPQSDYQYSSLTEESKEPLRVLYGNRCQICQSSKKKNRLSIDHDHDTGRVRGLLCISCNLHLGALGDSLEGVLKAHEYLLVARLLVL